MADREFKIKITTQADASGAKEAKQELEGFTPEMWKYSEALKDFYDWRIRGLTH